MTQVDVHFKSGNVVALMNDIGDYEDLIEMLADQTINVFVLGDEDTENMIVIPRENIDYLEVRDVQREL